MIKFCSRCQLDAEFTPAGKMCQECNKAYQRRHYLDNKETYNSKARNHNKKMTQWLWTILCQSVCQDCGETDPVVFEFDHVRGKKLGNVAEMARSGCGQQRIIDEIKKCKVVCANCHRRRTYERCGSYRCAAID
jgi:hypothetical protein